jgi:hypothetical protein
MPGPSHPSWLGHSNYTWTENGEFKLFLGSHEHFAYLAYFSTLKIEAVSSSEISVHSRSQENSTVACRPVAKQRQQNCTRPLLGNDP